jgi:hypothetical protein
LGKAFPDKGRGRVHVHLDSAVPPEGRDQVHLDSAESVHLRTIRVNKHGDFWGKKVTIPKDLSPGSYTVIAHGYDGQELASKTSARNPAGNHQPFEITAPVPAKGNAPTPPRPPDDRDSIGEPSGPGAGSPATARSDRPTTGRPGSGGTERTRGAGDPSRAGAPGTNGGAPSEGSGDLGLVTAPSGQPLFRDSLPSAAITGGRRPFGQPSGRSASGDLWSGFGSGRTPSLESRRGDPPAEENAGLDIGLAAGTGFLGLGLAALFGSFLVAEVRRRRKAVRA